jgi:sodium pump decarboxylase gamma subunit
MANLQVGLQLMVIGMGIVFLVLFLLMYIMKIMSALISNASAKQPPESAAIVAERTDDEEIAVVMAVVAGMLEEVKGNFVQIHVSQAK